MRLASVVASLLKRLSMVETAADQRTETLEEELCLGAVLDDPSCSMNQYQHEKENGHIKSPIGVSAVLECTGQTTFWVRLAGVPTVMSIHSSEWTVAPGGLCGRNNGRSSRMGI